MDHLLATSFSMADAKSRIHYYGARVGSALEPSERLFRRWMLRRHWVGDNRHTWNYKDRGIEGPSATF